MKKIMSAFACFVTVSIFGIIFSGMALAGSIIYVNAGATGGNNGTSWTDAYTDLQNALGRAAVGDEIWVATGTYTPAGHGGDSNATFQLKSGVALYGGFAGTETQRDQRNFKANITILSGDLNRDDASGGNNSENSYHVITSGGTDTTAVLNGFSIIGGNATGGNGGGIYNYRGSPTVVNCTFSGNSAFRGGGMYNLYEGTPTLTDCIFSGNSAQSMGGGMYNDMFNNPTLTNCAFLGNSASYGGGACIYNYSDSVMINCTFSGNSAAYLGGGIFNGYRCNSTLTNCTFSGNSAQSQGGGIYNDRYNNPTLINCILWADTPLEIFNGQNALPNITYSDIQGGYDGIGNIDLDPLFVDADGADNVVGTADDNLRLLAGSPCIDEGDPDPKYNDYDGTRNDMGVFGGPFGMHTGKLLLWNKLGSDAEVLNSEIGPDGVITGNSNYLPAKFDYGVTNADWQAYVSFDNFVLGTEQGTVEFWFKTDFDVVDGCATDGGPQKWWITQCAYASTPGIDNASYFYVFFDSDSYSGRMGIGISGQNGQYAYIYPYSNSPNAFNWMAGELHHFAVSYKHPEFAGDKTLAVYLDGAEAGSSTVDWGTYLKGTAPLVLNMNTGQPTGSSHTVIDNIKIYNYAKTDFSDRFTEDGSPNVAPIAKSQNITTREYIPIDITLTATDANNQILTYEISGFPVNGTITAPDTKGKVTYMPKTGYYGVDSFTFRAFDGQLYSDPAAVNITVIMNNPPILNPIGSKTIDEAQALQFTVSATDPDGDALTYPVSNLPAGSAFDPTTRVFSWMPTYNQSGIYPVTFKVTDAFGAEASETIQITVNNVNRSPVARIMVLSINGHTVRVSAADSSDPDIGDTLTYRWYCEPPLGGIFGLPVITANGAEATINYPRNLPSGTYRIWVYVSDSSGITSAASVSAHINWPPVARILDIRRIIFNLYFFGGKGTDDDGIITGYEWTSSRDGRLGYLPVGLHTLSKGAHIISFRVRDSDGTWSSTATRGIVVK